MFVTILFWIYFAALFFIYGVALRELLARSSGFLLGTVHPALLVFLGMVFWAVGGMVLSLFIPLSWLAQAVVISGGLVLAVAFRRQLWMAVLALPPYFRGFGFWLIFLAGILFALAASTLSPSNGDTPLYHAQSIHWMEEYAVVPGLGNFHSRLAFNSSWLVINALFSFAWATGRSLHILPSFLFVTWVWYLASQFSSPMEGMREEWVPRTLAGALYLGGMLPFLQTELSSPGTDFPVAILVSVVSLAWLGAFGRAGTLDRPGDLLVAACLAMVVPTIKLSALPILLLSGIAFWLVRPNGPRSLFSLVWLPLLVIFVFLPWLLRNIILSGYLVFPFPGLDVFSFDWKIPLDQVVDASADVYLVGRGLDLFPEANRTLSMSQWLPGWFLMQDVHARLLIASAFLAPIFPAVLYLIRQKKPHTWYVLIFLATYAGITYWLMTAPGVRFGIGFLVGAIVIGLYPFVSGMRWKSSAKALMPMIAFLVMFGSLGLALQKTPELTFSSLYARWKWPADYSLEQVAPCAVGKEQAFCATRLRACGYHAFPCAVAVLPGLEMRGETWQDGFRQTSGE